MGMIERFGESWFLSRGFAESQQTIEVIERPDGKRKKLPPKAKKVPFGFSRALPKKKRKK
jgi:hypothetical protein